MDNILTESNDHKQIANVCPDNAVSNNICHDSKRSSIVSESRDSINALSENDNKINNDVSKFLMNLATTTEKKEKHP